MKIVGLFCLATSALASTKCWEDYKPKKASSAGVTFPGTEGCTSTSKPALNMKSDAVSQAADENTNDDCCKPAPLCSTRYLAYVDGSKGDYECMADTMPTGNCVTSDGDGKCGDVDASWPSSNISKNADKNACCRMKCDHATKGFGAYSASPGEKQTCPEKHGEYKIAADKFCKGATCGSADQEACCQKKCSVGFILDPDGKATVDAAKGQDLKCPKGKFQLADAHCKGSKCKTTDTDACCQQQCSENFQIKGGKDAKKKVECPEVGDTVHATAFCKGKECKSTDENVCCRRPCSKSFKLKSGTDEKLPLTCPEGKIASGKYEMTVVDGSCKGICTQEDDEAACCAMKCTDKDHGYVISSAKKPASGFKCPKDTIVAVKVECNGKCSAADEPSCCVSAQNNSSTVGDARGVGLAASVAILVILRAVL